MESMTVPTCAWATVKIGHIVAVSKYCDDLHPLEVYMVRPRGQKKASPTLLCAFHGQYWPKKGEDELEARRRTRSTRLRIDGKTRAASDAAHNAGWGKRRGKPISVVPTERL